MCVLTDEDGAEEEGDGDVYNRCRHVQKPVGSHGEEPQEKQEEEQTVLVLLHLEDTTGQRRLTLQGQEVTALSDYISRNEFTGFLM